MKKVLLPLLFFNFFFVSENVLALQLGSERFVDFTEGAPDYGVLVHMGHDPQVKSNMYFTDQKFVSGIAGHAFPEGTGQKYFVANMMNFQGNYVMAAAKTDPRTPGFIMNSMDKLLTDPQAELELSEGLVASKLSAAQAGENAARYIAPEILTPDVGTYQTADNQQSFESAYDNVLLGKAEEALFKGDESQSIEYFDKKLKDFKNSNDKQNQAGGYQKDALMRSKKTAETFRDFFQLKATVSQQNLDLMPTKGSLVNGCHQNTPSGENQLSIYQSSMPQSEAAFYNLQPPQYPFDFCEQYVHNEESFLIRNRPVQGQLETLVSDSTQMAEGLEEISQTLSDQSLSIEEIASVLSNNEAWQTLSKRSLAYKECAKSKCLDPALETFGKIVDYPGAENHRSQLRKEIRQSILEVIASGRMSEAQSRLLESSELSKSNPLALKKKNKDKVKKQSSPLLGELRDRRGRSLRKGREVASEKDEIIFYQGKKYPRGGGYFRGDDGVLNGPSGKPVQGYANKPENDLFEIISRRYMIKFSRNSP